MAPLRQQAPSISLSLKDVSPWAGSVALSSWGTSSHGLSHLFSSLYPWSYDDRRTLSIMLTKLSWVFLAYLSCVIIFNSVATTQKQDTGIAMLSLTLFFESVCFPTIVALGIRGLGRHTKRGSGWIVAGVSGGAAVPPILGASVSSLCYSLLYGRGMG